MQETQLQNKDINEIDNEVRQWYTNIITAMNNTIPKSKSTNIFTFKPDREIKYLQNQYNMLSQNARHSGWTLHHYRQYKNIQNILKDKYIEIANKRWNDKLQEITEKEKDPKVFWQKINKLKGNKQTSTPYLIDKDGNKKYKEEEKCSLLRETWKDVFRITPEEDADFCQINNNRVTDFLTNNTERISTHPTIDFHLLDNNFMTKEIITDDIKRRIFKLKDNSPGQSSISKKILLNLPDQALENLRNIFNACLCSGYFPSAFKKAVIKFIPKPGKPTHEPTYFTIRSASQDT